MADHDNAAARELVYCHSCEEEWWKDEQGLTCPQCRSEAVEIIELDSDPRANHDEFDESLSDNPLSNPHHPLHDLHHHQPWEHEGRGSDDVSDPEEGDISHVEWTGPAGVRYTSTTYQSTGLPGTGNRAGNGNGNGDPPNMGFDAFGPILQNLMGPAGFFAQAQQQNHHQPRSDGGSAQQEGRSPLQEGPSMLGTSPRSRGGITVTTHGMGSQPTTHQLPIDDLGGILNTFLGRALGNPGAPGSGGGEQRGQPSPLTLLQQLFNPANARMGDAVYSNEALDRVITQLMEQHSTSTAPGPASESAIESLPKLIITKEQQDSNAKAECSICMEAAELGTEVTELPCKHWFHGDCVSEWLRQHDTCPQCRRGIMAKDGDDNTVRQTGQQPRHWQFSGDDLRRSESAEASQRAPDMNTGISDMQGSGTASSPIRIPESPSRHSQSPPGNRGESNRGLTGLANNIMGRIRRRSNSHGGNGDSKGGQ